MHSLAGEGPWTCISSVVTEGVGSSRFGRMGIAESSLLGFGGVLGYCSLNIVVLIAAAASFIAVAPALAAPAGTERRPNTKDTYAQYLWLFGVPIAALCTILHILYTYLTGEFYFRLLAYLPLGLLAASIALMSFSTPQTIKSEPRRIK